MQKGDLIGGIGAIGSTVFAVLGFLWNIDIIQMMFTFLAGAFSTYVVQHRLQVESAKRRISREHGILMRDKIYGPLFTALNQLSVKIMDTSGGTHPENPLAKMESVLEDHLYLLVEEELRRKISEIHDGCILWGDLLLRANRAVYNIAQRKLTRAFPDLKDLDSRQIYFYLYEHGMVHSSFPFQAAVLQKVNPLNLFKRKMAKLESPEIRVVGGQHQFEDLGKIMNVFTETERLAWKEKRLSEYTAKRERLTHDIESLIPELRKRITSEK